MLKSSTLTMTLGLALMTGIGQAHSAQLYYTFTTQLPDEYYEVAGLPVANDPASFVLMVDDAVTSSVLPDGRVVSHGHTVERNLDSEWYRMDYYTEMVSGPGLEFDGSDGRGRGSFRATVGYDSDGYNQQAEFTFSGTASNGRLNLDIWAYHDTVPQAAMATYDSFTQWFESAHLGGSHSEVVISNGGQYGRYSGLTLTLADISDAPPPSVVPVPASFLLMGSGLAGLLVAKGRRKNKSATFKTSLI